MLLSSPGHVSGCYRKAIGGIGMFTVFLKAMSSFPQSQTVQMYATGAICHLLWPRCRENVQRFMKAKGIETLVTTMTNFPGVAYIQQLGCDIVCECVETLNNRDQLIERDVLIVVSRALKNHRENETVKKYARKALKALADED
jgi:hypothetical protein